MSPSSDSLARVSPYLGSPVTLDSVPRSPLSPSAEFHGSLLSRSTPTYSILGEGVRESFLPVFFQELLGQVFHTVIDGPANPFAAALLPLAHSSSTVLSAIQALTGLHIGSKGGDPQIRAEGLRHQGRAIRQLACDLSDPAVANSDAALASSLILCVCEQVRLSVPLPARLWH